MIAMCFNLLAAVLALVVLKPMRARHFANARVQEPAAASESSDVARTRLT